jgi:PAS domain S-box-containing protein
MALLNFSDSQGDSKVLQQQLTEERDKAYAIISLMSEGLLAVDTQDKVILVNKTAEKILGIESSQIAGKHLLSVLKIFKGDRELEFEERPIYKTIQTGESYRLGLEDDVYFQVEGKEKLPVALSTSPLKGGGITGAVVVFRDITKEKESKSIIEQQVVERTKELNQKNAALTQAKEEISKGWLQLQVEKARLQASIDSVSLGFMMFDYEGKLLFINPAVEKITGVRLDIRDIDSVDKSLGEKFALKDIFRQCLSQKHAVNINELSFNNRFLHLYLAPIFSTDEEHVVLGVVVLIEDQTEARVLDRSKDEFFSIASHELRTPLTAIRGNVSLIKQYYKDKLSDQNFAEMIDDIYDSSVRLIRIVNDFLNVSRLEQGKIDFKLEEVDLVSLISKKIEEINSLAAQKNISITFNQAAIVVPHVYGDKDRLSEVILNLLGNAIKYTDKGSVSVRVSEQDGKVKASFSDTGKGIDDTQKSLLFRKFQQAGKNILTRDSTQGTGLGLYISKLMMDGMGGSIFLESSIPGQGSTFSIAIPVRVANLASKTTSEDVGQTTDQDLSKQASQIVQAVNNFQSVTS